LEQSQIQAEAMRAQEEEMRQNMEELAATQEEMARKQKAIEESDQRNRLFFDSAFYGILGVNDSGTIVNVNQSASKIIDRRVGEITGHPIDDVFKGLRFELFDKFIGKSRRVLVKTTQKKAEVVLSKASIEQGDMYVVYVNGDIADVLKKEEELAKNLMQMDELQKELNALKAK